MLTSSRHAARNQVPYASLPRQCACQPALVPAKQRHTVRPLPLRRCWLFHPSAHDQHLPGCHCHTAHTTACRGSEPELLTAAAGAAAAAAARSELELRCTTLMRYTTILLHPWLGSCCGTDQCYCKSCGEPQALHCRPAALDIQSPAGTASRRLAARPPSNCECCHGGSGGSNRCATHHDGCGQLPQQPVASCSPASRNENRTVM